MVNPIEFSIEFFEKHSKISWTITIFIAILIFYFSSITFGPSIPGIKLNLSTLFHLAAYFLLGIFLLFALVKGKKKSFIFIAIVLALFYGASDEFHQLFVLGRNCSFSDFLLDSCGILFASFLYVLSLRFRKKSSLQPKNLS